MKKRSKALILASVASMIDQFNMPNIQLLVEYGYDVDVVCNCKEGNNISDERVREMATKLKEMGVRVMHAPIPRKITDVRGIRKSLVQVKKLCNKNKYTLLHCHSPIGSVVARLAAAEARKKYGTKVIYTAHGFHFYKGAPKKNWFIFYPIEKVCSYLTDVLITINKEDYAFAKKHMNAGRVVYIPGVGVDTTKFCLKDFDAAEKKKEIGLELDDVMVLSVGELNQNKNQEIIVRALAKMEHSKIHYVIAGKGDTGEYLMQLASELGVNLHLLAYRTDIIELLNAADVFVFPSFREGLSVALMEAMAAGLPCVVSKIRGNVDLVDTKGGYLCKPDDVDAFYVALEKLKDVEQQEQMGQHNREVMQQFDVHRIMEMVADIYGVR